MANAWNQLELANEAAELDLLLIGWLFVDSVTFDVSLLEQKEDRCSRQDNLFIRKVRMMITVFMFGRHLGSG